MLHEHSEFESKFEVDNSIYLRSFSTDNRYLRQGDAKQALITLPEFIMSNFPHIIYLTLLVDVPNTVAHDIYLKLGFEQGNQVEGERYPAYCMVKKIAG